MVYGNVYRLLRLGDGAECIWHESICRRRIDEHKAIHIGIELHFKNEQLQKRALVRNMGCAILEFHH